MKDYHVRIRRVSAASPSCALVACLVLSACRTLLAAREPAQPIAVEAALAGDVDLQRGLELANAQVVEDASGRAARFVVRNGSDADRECAYHIDWFDAAGRSIESRPSLWFPLRLGAGEQIEVRAPAPSRDAVSFRFLAQRIERIRRAAGPLTSNRP